MDSWLRPILFALLAAAAAFIVLGTTASAVLGVVNSALTWPSWVGGVGVIVMVAVAVITAARAHRRQRS